MKKLTKKQQKQIDDLYYDGVDFLDAMIDKITKKTLEGTKGWEKLSWMKLVGMAEDSLTRQRQGCGDQLIDAANYLLFAWIRAGRP